MHFLANLFLFALAFLGVIVVVASLIGAAVLAIQEHYGRPVRDSGFGQAISATDRLHAEAQRAIRDLEDLANRGDR